GRRVATGAGRGGAARPRRAFSTVGPGRSCLGRKTAWPWAGAAATGDLFDAKSRYAASRAVSDVARGVALAGLADRRGSAGGEFGQALRFARSSIRGPGSAYSPDEFGRRAGTALGGEP